MPTIFYEGTKLPKFKDTYVDGRLKCHYFYSLEPAHHLYLEVRYNNKNQIIKYIKHKYNNGYYEYLTLVNGPDGQKYLKDQLYEASPYCKYIDETDEKGNYHLTVHRFNHDLSPRSSEYIVNGKIIKEDFYKNGKKETIKYPGGKDIKLYKKDSDQPDLKHRK